MTEEYAKSNKHEAITAKKAGYANALKEQAEVTEELIANITHSHSQQIEALVKATTESMKEMIALLKSQESKKEEKQGGHTKSDRQKKKEEKQRKWREAKPCVHCGNKHPSKEDNLCWELEVNAAARPQGWKSTKST